MVDCYSCHSSQLKCRVYYLMHFILKTLFMKYIIVAKWQLREALHVSTGTHTGKIALYFLRVRALTFFLLSLSSSFLPRTGIVLFFAKFNSKR